MDFSLLEFVPDGIVVADENGTIVYANATAVELFGWERDELVGQAVESLIPARHRSVHLGLRRGYHEAPRPRPMGLGMDLAALRKDGTEFPAEISLSPLRSGGITWAVAAVRDATERRRIEAKALLYRQAKEEVRARDEFLSVASHELRTPVTALHVQLQMLQRVVERTGAPGPGQGTGGVARPAGAPPGRAGRGPARPLQDPARTDGALPRGGRRRRRWRGRWPPPTRPISTWRAAPRSAWWRPGP